MSSKHRQRRVHLWAGAGSGYRGMRANKVWQTPPGGWKRIVNEGTGSRMGQAESEMRTAGRGPDLLRVDK